MYYEYDYDMYRTAVSKLPVEDGGRPVSGLPYVSIHPARARSRKLVIDDGEAAAVRLRWHQTNQNTKRKRHPPNSKLEMLLVYLVPGTSYQYTANSNPAVVCTTSAPGTWYWCSYYQVPVRTYLVLDTLVLVFIRSGCCGPVVGRRSVHQ